MTEQEKQELSNKVAEKYGIEPYTIYIAGETSSGCDNCNGYVPITDDAWLHDDSARCFDLMVENTIEVAYTKHIAVANYYGTNCIQVPFNGYSTKQEATRIAILRALLAKD